MASGPKTWSLPAAIVTTWEITPNPGKIKMYTSGCPKNQKRCWKRRGSPAPAGSKNDLLKFRSVKSIVRAPASTGNLRIKRRAVIANDQRKIGRAPHGRPGKLASASVTRKFSEPRIEETPAKCNEKIARSTAAPECAIPALKGG